MQNEIINNLVTTFAKLPGLGPKSAKRCILYLLKKEAYLTSLIPQLQELKDKMQRCVICYNYATSATCEICADKDRENKICVVEDIDSLWAVERSLCFSGKYHILDGVLSASYGIAMQDLNIAPLLERVKDEQVQEVILALNPTIDGQTTIAYLQQQLEVVGKGLATGGVKVSVLSLGIPIGSELDYIDSATLTTAMLFRREI